EVAGLRSGMAVRGPVDPDRQDQQGDRDGEHSVAEGFDAGRLHAAEPIGSGRPRLLDGFRPAEKGQNALHVESEAISTDIEALERELARLPSHVEDDSSSFPSLEQPVATPL